MNRREFLKMGGTIALGAIAFPEMLASHPGRKTPKKLVGACYFGISESTLKKVFAEALSKGGEYADLFFEHTEDNNVVLMDGEVNQTQSNIDFGVGIRVLSEGRTGYAYTENITEKELLKVAKTAAQIASSPLAKPLAYDLTELKFSNYYSMKRALNEVSVAEKIPYIKHLNDAIFALDKRVVKVRAYLADSVSHIFFANSEGVSYTDIRPMISFGATCSMQQENQIESGYVGRSYRMGYELINQKIVEELAHEVVDKTAFLFEATRPKGGEMPVVLGAGSSGILLHEAIGHAFEADFNRKNTSIFSDKLHKKVCSEYINVVDDATLPAYRGSLNVDDEGVIGQKTYIVKDGILNSYLHDRISANYYNVASTGNGRRENFRYFPIPRMRCTYMENGNMSEEELIKGVKKGIYCDVFTNGQVQIGAGDFTFFVKSGRLIENGKLTRPIKDVNIIGNGPQALADIIGVANNLKIDNGRWTCGKDGQHAPVSQGMPSVLVKKLNVGGIN